MPGTMVLVAVKGNGGVDIVGSSLSLIFLFTIIPLRPLLDLDHS